MMMNFSLSNREASFSGVDEAEPSLLSLNACVSVEQKSFTLTFRDIMKCFLKSMLLVI